MIFIFQVNEQISQIKQSLKEIENSFADNELQMKLVQTRLNNRIRPSYPELLKYIVYFSVRIIYFIITHLKK